MGKINHYSVIGVMSGTSLDGLDLVKCVFFKKSRWHYKIEKGTTIKYSKKWSNILKTLHKKPLQKIQETNISYGSLIGKEINKFVRKNKFNVDFISSHGHTIFHQPKEKYTLQIGDGKTIANTTKLLTVSNFRELDVKLNGQGAPLVPIGDLHLFSRYKYCLNLGGFANISIKELSYIKAFDICPANIILNHLAHKLGFDYDKDGGLGKQGKCNTNLLDKLNKIEFYNQKTPKSLSREWLEDNILNIIELTKINIKDLLATFYEHIGCQIGRILKDNSVLISGGGAYNKYLCEKIKKYAKSEMIIAQKDIIDYKEAMIFGFLGVLKLRNETNCLKDVTGALKDNCGGDIYHPYITK